MKWYGSRNYYNIKKKSSKNRNLKLRKIFKKSSFKLHNKYSLKNFKISLYFPFNWSIVLIDKEMLDLINLIIYNLNYKFKLSFLKKFTSFNYDYLINTLTINFFLKNNFSIIFWNYFKFLFFSFSRIFFKKLKFKGKGYYIYKNTRNTIALQFGYSHMFYLYCSIITVKFITKTTILLFGTNYFDLLKKSYSLFNIKKINIFTGKGIRFSRQILYKKTGKVSSYR